MLKHVLQEDRIILVAEFNQQAQLDSIHSL